MEAQGQALETLEELHAQDLVHALQDPDLVVVEGHDQRGDDDPRGDADPDHPRQECAPRVRIEGRDVDESGGVEPEEHGLERQQRLPLEDAREERVEQQDPQRKERERDRAEAEEEANEVPRTGRRSWAQRQSSRTMIRKPSRSARPPVPRCSKERSPGAANSFLLAASLEGSDGGAAGEIRGTRAQRRS